MHVLAVGSGASGATWTGDDRGGYDLVVQTNGSVLNGGYFDHYIAIDKNSANYDWFRVGVMGADRLILNPRLATLAESILDMHPDHPRPQIDIFWGADPPHTIQSPPGTNKSLHDGVMRDKIACCGTVLHSILHYYSWVPNVHKITLLGFEHELLPDGRMHFYDTEPMTPEMQRRWRNNNFPAVARTTAQAIGFAMERVSVDVHMECGGLLRDMLT
jgi:hypothetical protein